jgi:hypothetical protein
MNPRKSAKENLFGGLALFCDFAFSVLAEIWRFGDTVTKIT